MLTDRDKISNLYRAPSIYVSYQVSVHLAKQFQRRRFLEIDQSETSIAYGGHVCLVYGSKRNERSLCFLSSFGSDDDLAKRFQMRRFLKIDQSETRIAYGDHVFLTNRDEFSNLHRGPSIDASYQVSIHLAKRFQRRRFLNSQSETRIACGGHIC